MHKGDSYEVRRKNNYDDNAFYPVYDWLLKQP